MPRFSVLVTGTPLIAAQNRLNGANIPTLGAGAHCGDAPPSGWDLNTLRAVVDAETPQEAHEKVRRQLPADGTYELGETKPYGDS